MILQKVKNRLTEIGETIYTAGKSLSEWQISASSDKKGSRRGQWELFTVPGSWKQKNAIIRFRRELIIPEEFAGREVALVVAPGSEALLRVDGMPYQGLINGSQEVLLCSSAKGGGHFKLTIEAWGGLTEEEHLFSKCALAIVNSAVRNYYHNLRVALEATVSMPEGSFERSNLLSILNGSIDSVDYSNVGDEAYLESIEQANELLKESVYSGPQAQDTKSICLVAHSHLDVAWLWPVRETVRKSARTFSTVLKCMEEYPDFYFTQSQPQLYEFAKEHYPIIYQRIKERVKEGRWEPIGAFWVEPDCNIPSGESLVRQILFGKRFFNKEFGIDTETLWLPDAFGFTWSLPQIMKRSGLKYFMTAKLIWNELNKPLAPLFLWQGIDGSKVFSCIPVLGHDGEVSPTRLTKHWKMCCPGEVNPIVGAKIEGYSSDLFQQKGLFNEGLVLYGFGDGGGGVNRDQLETLTRVSNLKDLPPARPGKAEAYFRRAEKSASTPHIWNDELYFETHRGTYTTQARTKKNNRKSEILYRNAEIFSSLSNIYGKPYEQEALNRGWKKILLNQFHDILPGSSIGEVHQESAKDYIEIFKIGRETLTNSLKSLASEVDTQGAGEAILIFNSLSWQRSDLVTLELRSKGEDFLILDSEGGEVTYQIVERRGQKVKILFFARNVPSLGYSVYRLVKGKPRNPVNPFETKDYLIESPFFRIELDSDGDLRSVYDKQADREVLADGAKGNLLQTFEDKPNEWEAWNIDICYQDKELSLFRTAGVKAVEFGPVRAGIKVTKRSKNSRIRQSIFIYGNLPRIDFATEVDWGEKRVLLKAAFPVDVHANRATYEIQFGNIERPTHWNTSWDIAKFEVWGHRWADLSEDDYGVSLLNDCKYGHDIKDNTMRLSLLRATTYPDEHADEGQHRFTYSLYPHQANWRSGKTIQRAHELNAPLLTLVEPSHPGGLPPYYSFVRTDRENVFVEALKKSEDSSDYILRLYEGYGQRGPVVLDFSADLEDAVECDLMEREVAPVEFSRNRLPFYIKPYEIRSFKLSFK